MTATAARWLRGLCWLCRKPEQEVTFIGPVEVDGKKAPGFACRSCVEWSHRYVDLYVRQLDQRPAC